MLTIILLGLVNRSLADRIPPVNIANTNIIQKVRILKYGKNPVFFDKKYCIPQKRDGRNSGMSGP
jgi:hypothetical protein